MPADRKTDPVALVVKCILVQTRHHHQIAADARQPAMKRDHAVFVVYMKHMEPFTAQGRVLATQPDHLAREAMLIGHMLVGTFSPSHQISSSGRPGQSVQYLSSRNSWPMKIIGTPGAVSSRPVATLARLRAYQERELLGSASAAMRGCRSYRG